MFTYSLVKRTATRHDSGRTRDLTVRLAEHKQREMPTHIEAQAMENRNSNRLPDRKLSAPF